MDDPYMRTGVSAASSATGLWHSWMMGRRRFNPEFKTGLADQEGHGHGNAGHRAWMSLKTELPTYP